RHLRSSPTRRSSDLHMRFVGVIVARSGFVRAPKPDEIRRDDAMAMRNEARNHLAIEKGPARLAVHQQDGRLVARSFIDRRDPQQDRKSTRLNSSHVK